MNAKVVRGNSRHKCTSTTHDNNEWIGAGVRQPVLFEGRLWNRGTYSCRRTAGSGGSKATLTHTGNTMMKEERQ